ncbi:MAG: hypothetical protein NT023_23300 [Armatimonadetes bacterium]|nr:hypothetical protein [Armatimonadota bacterium]
MSGSKASALFLQSANCLPSDFKGAGYPSLRDTFGEEILDLLLFFGCHGAAVRGQGEGLFAGLAEATLRTRTVLAAFDDMVGLVTIGAG